MRNPQAKHNPHPQPAKKIRERKFTGPNAEIKKIAAAARESGTTYGKYVAAAGTKTAKTSKKKETVKKPSGCRDCIHCRQERRVESSTRWPIQRTFYCFEKAESPRYICARDDKKHGKSMLESSPEWCPIKEKKGDGHGTF